MNLFSKLAFLVSAATATLALSGCDLYSYTTPVCTASNAADVSSLTGPYKIGVSLGGQTGSFPPVTAQLEGRTGGQLVIKMPKSSGQADQTYNVCTIAGKMIAEGHNSKTPQTPQPFLVSTTAKGFVFTAVKFDVPAMQKLAPVKTTTVPASHDFPEVVNVYIVNNAQLALAVLANELQPDNGIQLIFNH